MTANSRHQRRARSRYINRELSWLAFNRRVLEEAQNPANPLLERLKFLAIFESNLDEFYMVRVSGLVEQFEAGVLTASPDGLRPVDQLEEIASTAQPLRDTATQLYEKDLREKLEKSAIYIREYRHLKPEKRAELDEYFRREVFPVITPLLLRTENLPHISNRSLNILVDLKERKDHESFARIKVPVALNRLIRLYPKRNEFVLLEDLLMHHIDSFFPGVQVKSAHQFRLIRDTDMELREGGADIVRAIEENIHLRQFGDPVLLQVQKGTPERVISYLMRIFELDTDEVIRVSGLLDFGVFWELYRLDKPTLKFPSHIPASDPRLETFGTLFDTVAQEDVLLHHPFDSFRAVEEFVGSGANDSSVVGVKQTLYRVGSESKIVESILSAGEKGKQTAVVVELKARFDESNNISWAKAMDQAGVHVAYGFPEMKTHAKLAMVVRREEHGIRSYVHVGSGNYNPQTARSYTDIGLLTCDSAICQDVAELFNYLTGLSRQKSFRKLLVAPINLRQGIIDRIRREVACKQAGKAAHILWKCNAIVDPEIIEELYAASQAGVKIDLLVRGICCLRPGVPGISENIRIVSLVGRFLEHSRIYWFDNGGNPEVFIGSADIMRRNLERRIEALVPIDSKELQIYIREQILDTYLRDNTNSWLLKSDGTYTRITAGKLPQFSAQNALMSSRTKSNARFARPNSS